MKNEIKVLSGEMFDETQFGVRFEVNHFPGIEVLLVFEKWKGTYWRCISRSGRVYIGEVEWEWMEEHNVRLINYFINECELTKIPLLFLVPTND